MLEQLSKHYKANISSYGLVFRNFPISYFLSNLCIISIPISALFLVIGIILSILGIKSAPLFILPIVISFLFTVVTIIWLNNKVKKYIRKQYTLKSKKGLWRTPEFNEMQYNLLVEYLKNHNLYTEDKIKLLIELLHKEIDQNRLPPLVIPSVLITFSIPIWSQYVTFTYKSLQDSDKLAVSMISIYLFILVVLCALLIGGGRRIIEELRDNGISIVSFNKGLIKKLEEVLLRF